MEKEKIVELLGESPVKVAELLAAFEEMNVVNIADIFKDESKETILRIFRLLPKSMAAEVPLVTIIRSGDTATLYSRR